MTREDYVAALETIRGIVESDARIPVDAQVAIIAEVNRVVSNKPAKYGEYDQCIVCNHTPRYCSC